MISCFRFSELASWISSTERELKKIKENVNDTTKYKQCKASVGVSPWLTKFCSKVVELFYYRDHGSSVDSSYS